MPSPRSSEVPFDLLVEALEPRIAPTGLVGNAGSILNAPDSNYLAYNLAPSPGHLGFIPQGNGVFAIQLSGDGTANGDKINIFNGAGGSSAFPTFLQANNGQVLAFFKDFNNDGQVNTNELVGLSMGTASAATVNGNVNGDVVANLAADGLTLFNQNGNPATETIAGLRAVSVTGSILAGGGIANLGVSQGVNQVLAGTAASGYGYHFNGDPNSPVSGIYSVPAPGVGQVGAGITNSSLGAVGIVHSGDGGLNANGGEITGLLINADTNGFTIQSGAGGASAGIKGGNGGNISNLTVGLLPAINDFTAHDPINILGGHGGASEVGLKGGTGGGLDNIAVGFVIDANGNRAQSGFLFADNVALHGGTGGDGFKGGTGGAVTNAMVVVGTPDNPGGADATDPAVVKILSGDGGAQVNGGLGGKSGKGGLISTVSVSDLNTDATRTTFTGLPANATATHAQLLVHAGDGGAVLDSGKGKFGGSIDHVTLLGYRLDVTAGDGANGVGAGGAGGGITAVSILSRSDLLPTELILDAGHGGRADNGFAGSGGNIDTVQVSNSNFSNLLINSGTHGNGGDAQGITGGTGGGGGSVANVLITGSRNYFTPDTNVRIAPGAALLRAGDGGLGPNGGGAGGSMDGVQIFGGNFDLRLFAGQGGPAFASGAGGLGGSVTNVGLSNQPLPVPPQLLAGNAPEANLTVTAGAGGNGAGAGPGGAGGSIVGTNLASTQDATFTAGAGGSGLLGASGAGGSVTTSAAQALFGSVTVTAGSAGVLGGTAGVGGSVNGFIGSAGFQIATSAFSQLSKADIAQLTAQLGRTPQVSDFPGDPRTNVNRGNFTLTAGDGGAGGAGGGILNSGTATLTPGSVTVTAGRGSGQNGVVGAGGGIDTFTGFVGGFGATRFTAGAGGNGGASPGGTINAVILRGGNGALTPTAGTPPVALTFDAGAGGDAGGGRKGGNGGSVTNVTVANLAANTVFHHVAAGDGGNGLVKGGKGGSVTGLHVGLPGENADIGLRTGANFGYSAAQNPVTGAFTNAGGIFAGAGGAGQQAPRPGNVTDVTAAAIASIVAGKTASPQLANTVDNIFLEGFTQAQVNAVGDFTNFTGNGTTPAASIVGSVVNPIPGGGGNVFHYVGMPSGGGTFHLGDVPLDGLIAAVNLGQNRSFIPEAVLSFDPATQGFQLVDYRDPGFVTNGA